MDIQKDLIKAALSEALFESGLAKDTINVSKASKILSRRLVENGIKSGKLPIVSAGGKNSNHLIKVTDLVNYRNELFEKGKLKK